MIKLIKRISCVCAALLALCLMLSPVSAAAEAADFEVESIDAPSHVSADTETLPVTVYGTGLFDGLIVQLLYGGEPLTSVFTTGSDTKQTAQLQIIPNTSHSTEYYQVAVFAPDGSDTGAFMLLGVEPAADSISAAQTLISLDGTDTHAELEIESNYQWHVSGCSASWLTATGDGLAGTSKLYIELEENTGDMRSAYIYLNTDGEQNAHLSVEVEQWGTTDPYSISTLTDEATGLSVSGSLHRDTLLHVNALDEESDLYIALSSFDSEQSVLAAYDAQLEAVEDTLAYRAPLELSLPLGEGVEDQPCRIVYLDVNMEISSVPAAIENGVVSAQIDNISPFAVITGSDAFITSASDTSPAHVDGSGKALRIVLYVLAAAAGLFILLYILAIALPKRTLMSANGSVCYYLGHKKLSGAPASFTAWAWRTSADIVLALKK